MAVIRVGEGLNEGITAGVKGGVNAGVNGGASAGVKILEYLKTNPGQNTEQIVNDIKCLVHSFEKEKWR